MWVSNVSPYWQATQWAQPVVPPTTNLKEVLLSRSHLSNQRFSIKFEVMTISRNNIQMPLTVTNEVHLLPLPLSMDILAHKAPWEGEPCLSPDCPLWSSFCCNSSWEWISMRCLSQSFLCKSKSHVSASDWWSLSHMPVLWTASGGWERGTWFLLQGQNYKEDKIPSFRKVIPQTRQPQTGLYPLKTFS